MCKYFFYQTPKWPKAQCRNKKILTELNFVCMLKIIFFISMALVALYYSHWIFEKHRVIESVREKKSLPPLIIQFTKRGLKKLKCFLTILAIWLCLLYDVHRRIVHLRFQRFQSLQVSDYPLQIYDFINVFPLAWKCSKSVKSDKLPSTMRELSLCMTMLIHFFFLSPQFSSFQKWFLFTLTFTSMREPFRLCGKRRKMNGKFHSNKKRGK